MGVYDAATKQIYAAAISAPTAGTGGLQVREAVLAAINYYRADMSPLIHINQITVDLAYDATSGVVTATYNGSISGGYGNYCTPRDGNDAVLNAIYSIGDPGGGHVELLTQRFGQVFNQCHIDTPLAQYRVGIPKDVFDRATHIFLPIGLSLRAASC